MKPYLEQLLQGTTDVEIGRPIVREYLQARILEILQQSGAFHCLSFHGGTSLRILYNLPRYSEYLDFSLDRAIEQYDFERYLAAIKQKLSAENYAVEIRAQINQTAVHKAFVRFRGLLHDLGLTPHPDQVIAVKLEIDTRPPLYTVVQSSLLKKRIDLQLYHHDPATLLAGKLLAALNREYTKGRDWFDLWWYLEQSMWPPPNFAYLNSGLEQAEHPGKLNEGNWKPVLHQRVQQLNWEVVFKDVEPFLIDTKLMSRFSKQRLLDLLA